MHNQKEWCISLVFTLVLSAGVLDSKERWDDDGWGLRIASETRPKNQQVRALAVLVFNNVSRRSMHCVS